MFVVLCSCFVVGVVCLCLFCFVCVLFRCVSVCADALCWGVLV